MLFTVTVLESTASNFPATFRAYNGSAIHPRLWTLGNLAL